MLALVIGLLILLVGLLSLSACICSSIFRLIHYPSTPPSLHFTSPHLTTKTHAWISVLNVWYQEYHGSFNTYSSNFEVKVPRCHKTIYCILWESWCGPKTIYMYEVNFYPFSLTQLALNHYLSTSHFTLLQRWMHKLNFCKVGYQSTMVAFDTGPFIFLGSRIG